MSKERILVVDDEAGVRSSLQGILEDEGYRVDTDSSAEAALARLSGGQYDLVLLDIWLPKMDGMEALERMIDDELDIPVIMISGHATIESAVKAIQLGAYNFVEKPLSLDKTLIAVQNALRHGRLQQENRALRERVEARHVLIGSSPVMRELKEQIGIAAPTNGRVLIFGENGTGKEVVARLVHTQSLRSKASFVEVNCAAIPEELIESELFGHVKGAFTGAVSDKIGKFEAADGGTLFLDEVADMSVKTQAKVLRVLQEQKFQAVGSTESIGVDCRVIAATNKVLEEEIRAGNFREDLYFRLNVIPFQMPPLRERREDIPTLVTHFIAGFCAEYGKQTKEPTAQALKRLVAYRWPGNVRELKNVIERLVIMVSRDVLEVSDSPLALTRGGDEPLEALGDFSSLASAREAFERQFIVRKLRENNDNVKKTAGALGIERSHLYRKMKAYSIK